MYRYLLRRILLVVPTLVGAAALVFLLMRLIPGDICAVRLGGGGGFSAKALSTCRAELGLDRPILLQFLDFLWGFLRLDFGTSMWSGKPVAEEIAARLPISLEIALLATVVAIAIAIPLGTLSALKPNTWIDHVVRTVAVAGISTPSFWLGIVSIIAVLDLSGWITGRPWMPPIEYVSIWQDPLRNLSMVILPALTVGYRYSAVTMRMTRSAMLEVMREDYIRTARAKGLLDRIIINRHALKNALLPVVTLIGIEFAFLIGGLVVTEQVFNVPGIGRLLVVAVFVLTNLAVDLLYAWLDPRIRFA
jgi:peptide/nickel transport system permease protein